MHETTHEEFIAKADAFITENEAWLESTVNSVGWTMRDLVAKVEANRPDSVCCPINPEHRMPAQSLETHVWKCERNNETYPNISNLDLNINDYLQGTKSILKEEFDHVVAQESDKTGASTKQSSSQTLAELLQAERDAKRRRAAHRGKRVHSNKKSYHEVMREVIANQMQTLDDGINYEESCDLKSKPAVQESVAQNTIFLGLGDTFYRGNPYKRWLTIEQEEKVMMEKTQEQIVKHSQDKRQEEDRNSRYSRSDYDHRSSRRDYREDRRRHHKSNEYNRDSRENECRNENRIKTEVNVSGKYRQSCDDDLKKHRSGHWNRDLKYEKREDLEKNIKCDYKKFQDFFENDRREELELGKLSESRNSSKTFAAELERKNERKQSLSDQEEKHHKKKSKKKKHKHKHKKKSRRSSSSS